MATVLTHRFEHPDPQRYFNVEIEAINYLLETSLSKHPKNPARLFSGAVNAAQLASFLDKPPAEAYSLLMTALDGAAAAFMLATIPDEPIQVSIAGHKVSYDTKRSKGAIDSHIWLEAVCWAMTLRRQELIEQLKRVSLDTLRSSPTGIDEYRHLLVTVVKAVIDEENADKAIAAVREQMEIDGAVGTYDQILQAFLDGLEALAHQNQDSLCKALTKLLEAHQSYWRNRSWRNDPKGLLSPLALGLASLGYDRGLHCDVQSGYMPEWLVRGNFLQEK